QRMERGSALILYEAYYWPMTDLLTGFQLVGGLLAAALMAIDGALTIGDFIAYAGMIGMIINPMRMLGRLIVQTSTGMVSYDRVMEIIKEERENLREGDEAPVSDLRGEVVFENVSFAYDKDVVLRNISFRCEAGQTVALLGSTGS